MRFIFLIAIVFLKGQSYSAEEISLINSGKQMSALPIYQTDLAIQNKVLTQQSLPANPLDPNTKILVERMKLSLLATQGGVGIAAPQVGINRRIVLVQRFDKEGFPVEYFINPVVLWRSKMQQLGPEGDLSIKDFRGNFHRSQVIQLQYFDLENQSHTELVEGFTAVIFQHEIDHLFGLLISEKEKTEAQKSYKKTDVYLEE